MTIKRVMYLYQLIKNVDVENFKKEMTCDNALKGCFLNVLAKLKKTDCDRKNDNIELIYRNINSGTTHSPYFKISGLENDCVISLSNQRRSEWMSFKIADELHNNYSIAKICYEAIYEMTAVMKFEDDEETVEYLEECDRINEKDDFVLPPYYCNECKEDIIKGYRYYCEECEDYDMCENCYKTIKHEHHLYEFPASYRPVDFSDEEDSDSFNIENVPLPLEDEDNTVDVPFAN